MVKLSIKIIVIFRQKPYFWGSIFAFLTIIFCPHFFAIFLVRTFFAIISKNTIYFKDFNLISIKLSLFVFSICLDMTTNILFFNDESMHKIYLDYGKYNFVSQIPQIVYSTIISESMDQLLKYLSLSEKEIYEVKKYKNIKEVADGIKKLIKCLKIKFFFFFFVCFIFMIFFGILYQFSVLFMKILKLFFLKIHQ